VLRRYNVELPLSNNALRCSSVAPPSSNALRRSVKLRRYNVELLLSNNAFRCNSVALSSSNGDRRIERFSGGVTDVTIVSDPM
jgi:hypothetical protein